jgi:hypothetical protein
MDPFPNGLPTQFLTIPLPKAIPMDEIMFSLVLVVMQSYYLSSGSIAYRRSVLNLEQDISDIVTATSLPRAPE